MSLPEQLAELRRLHDAGTLTDAEFAQAKARVLADGPAPAPTTAPATPTAADVPAAGSAHEVLQALADNDGDVNRAAAGDPDAIADQISQLSDRGLVELNSWESATVTIAGQRLLDSPTAALQLQTFPDAIDITDDEGLWSTAVGSATIVWDDEAIEVQTPHGLDTRPLGPATTLTPATDGQTCWLAVRDGDGLTRLVLPGAHPDQAAALAVAVADTTGTTVTAMHQELNTAAAGTSTDRSTTLDTISDRTATAHRLYKVLCMALTGVLVLVPAGADLDLPGWSSLLFFGYGGWIAAGRGHIWSDVLYLIPVAVVAAMFIG